MNRRKNGWLKWSAVAACLCLVILGAVMGERPALPPADANLILSENGVTIPPREVTLSRAGNQATLLARRFFIYEGRHYREYDRLWDAEGLFGEYLGTVTGLLDEWTPEEGYVDFAGSLEGDIYSVKGYDPSFMLCIRKSTKVADLYICDNGITLKYGSELYEDRLHLSGNVESVQYETWDDRDGQYQLNGADDVILDFIQDLDAGQFIPYYDVPLNKGRTDLSDTGLYSLHFQMKDGVTVRLCLYENGYVEFNGISLVCLQIPEETYHAMLERLDSQAK